MLTCILLVVTQMDTNLPYTGVYVTKVVTKWHIYIVLHCLYRYRAMFDVIEMPWYWPVDVNYHEAKAYCTWRGSEYRLPTEAEHHRLRGQEVTRKLQYFIECPIT